MVKVGRNDPCQCGSNKMYKECCHGIVDWEELSKKSMSEIAPYLSIRGKNLHFINRVLDVLGLDVNAGWVKVKESFSREAVRSIYEATLTLWPQDTNLEQLLSSTDDEVSSLYVGNYDPYSLTRGISRLCLYTDKIILVDPLMYPPSVRDSYNPILHPEKHRTNTLRWISMWMELAPWVAEGLVEIVRGPTDFNPGLNSHILDLQQAKLEEYPELTQLTNESAEASFDSREYEDSALYFMLMQSDESLLMDMEKNHPDATDKDREHFLKLLKQKRDSHPYYLEPLEINGKLSDELLSMSSGASYPEAKIIASMSNSFIATDILSRWKEIEMDRDYFKIDDKKWAPFSKAFQGLDLKYLDNVDLSTALDLRKQERLKDLRLFLRNVWLTSSSDEAFSEENVVNLSSELRERIREAEGEWSKIDEDLLNRFGVDMIAALGSFSTTGSAEWAAGAAVASSSVRLGIAKMKRYKFPERYPASFFMDLEKKQKKSKKGD